MRYGAYGAGPVVDDRLTQTRDSKCDRSSGVCDIFVKIFINDELAMETEVVHNEAEKELLVNFESELISKDSTVRIEMWDEDDEIYDTAEIAENSDILLNKTFPLEQLINKEYQKIYADQRPGRVTGKFPDNFVEIFNSEWSDES